MADGAILHTQIGQLNHSGSIKTPMLRYRANGGGRPAVGGDDVEIVSKKKK